MQFDIELIRAVYGSFSEKVKRARAAKSAAVRLPVPSGPANSCAWTMRPVFTGRMICSVRNLRARNSENELGSGIRTS